MQATASQMANGLFGLAFVIFFSTLVLLYLTQEYRFSWADFMDRERYL